MMIAAVQKNAYPDYQGKIPQFKAYKCQISIQGCTDHLISVWSNILYFPIAFSNRMKTPVSQCPLAEYCRFHKQLDNLILHFCSIYFV